MGTPEFPDLGRHCSVDDCNLLDFLPFTCDVCKQIFCLEHRSYSKHHCPNAADKDVTVLVCPLCAKAVRLISNEDPNVTWEHHVRTDCDPNNYAKVHKKPRCPVRGCRENLTASNKMVCKECKQEVCLKHRFGPDHGCKGPAKTGTKGSWFGTGPFIQSYNREKAAIGGASSSNAASSILPSDTLRTGWNQAASMFKASAEASVAKLNDFATNMRNAVGGPPPAAQGGGAKLGLNSSKMGRSSNNKELCPQCGAQFLSVSLLIQHVEKNHSTGKPGATPQEMVDYCPKCGRGFLDPISLVNHVEKDHGGTSSNHVRT